MWVIFPHCDMHSLHSPYLPVVTPHYGPSLPQGDNVYLLVLVACLACLPWILEVMPLQHPKGGFNTKARRQWQVNKRMV